MATTQCPSSHPLSDEAEGVDTFWEPSEEIRVNDDSYKAERFDYLGASDKRLVNGCLTIGDSTARRPGRKVSLVRNLDERLTESTV